MTVDSKIIFNELIVYVFVGLFSISTALVGWLCVQTIDLRDRTTSMIEHNRSIEQRMVAYEQTQECNTKTLNEMRLIMAEHGWRKE